MPEQIQDWSHQKFLHRAYNICSDYASLTTEITRIKQLLIDKNFPNYLVDEVIKEFINKKTRQQTSRSKQQYYQMLPNVTLLATEHNNQFLAILETFLIKQHGPKIDRRTEFFNNMLKNLTYGLLL